MKTIDAVNKVLKDNRMSMYRLAKLLNIQPIMVSNYIKKNVSMSTKTAAAFEAEFGIVISDVYTMRKRDNGAETPPAESE